MLVGSPLPDAILWAVVKALRLLYAATKVLILVLSADVSAARSMPIVAAGSFLSTVSVAPAMTDVRVLLALVTRMLLTSTEASVAFTALSSVGVARDAIVEIGCR